MMLKREEEREREGEKREEGGKGEVRDRDIQCVHKSCVICMQ